MRFIRHLLSHLLLISLIVGICAVYYFRYQVLPENYTHKIDQYAEKIDPRLLKIASKQQAGSEPAEMVVENTTEEPVEVAIVTPVAEPVVDNIEPAKSKQDEKMTAADVDEVGNTQVNPVNDVPVADEQKDEAPVKTESIASDVPVEKAPVTQVEVIDDDVASSGNDKEHASANDLLRSARSAFKQGKLDVAINKYNELIELENDEADFYGELGNVHYAMGGWDKAGVAYYEAATRLIEEGKLAQVSYLQRVLQGLDAERAEKLTEQLAKASRK